MSPLHYFEIETFNPSPFGCFGSRSGQPPSRFELMPHCNQPILSLQDLCRVPPEQLSILSLCRRVPRSSGSCPPACLTSSDGWALRQERIPEGPGGWGEG
eukprot:280031-Pelagomonas_calceolata.AAC.2